MNKKTYSEWIKENWLEAGGLINQSTASKILKVSRTRLRQMINEKKIYPYIYEKESPLVSFKQIIELKNKKEFKK
jgi:hypothetical protein